MSKTSEVIAGVGLADRPRKSRWPARMDLAQSPTGLVLGLFMWGHMFFVSIDPDLERRDVDGHEVLRGLLLLRPRLPGIVSVVVAVVFGLSWSHAFLAMRKFPANYRQYRMFIGHRKLLHHEDTTLWWVQVVTGFLLFFLAAAHLYQMLMHPGAIGPYESADRVWSGAGGRSTW